MPSHRELSNWYTRMGQHLEAGVVLAEALRICGGLPISGRETMARQIEAGLPFEEVLQGAPKWLPAPDRLFLAAAMQTGRLPQTFQDLADRHARVGATQLKVILGLIYPLGVFHLFALRMPITRMIDYELGFLWSLPTYLREVLMLLIPLWAILGGAYVLARRQHPLLTQWMRVIPLLRKYSRMQSLADFSHALGTFLHVGVPAPAAWRLSVKLTQEPKFRRALKTLSPVFEQGDDPADHLDEIGCFPPDFCATYKAGVATGQLDQNMLKAGAQFQSNANLAMTFASILYPSLLLVVVAALVIANIFKIYGNYLDVFKQF